MSMQLERTIPTESVAVGIGLGVFAYALFSVHDATVKWLVADFAIWQVLLSRSIVILIGCLSIGRARLIERARTTPLKGPLVFRAAITLAAWLCFYTASRWLPFAEMISLYFAAPVIVTLMAAPLLGEHVTWTRWMSVSLGFAGVLVIANPFGLTISVPALLVLAAATFWAYGVILMRRIARRESSLLQMLYTNGFFLVATAIGTALTWRTPSDWTTLLLMAGIGVIGGLAQFAMFEAVRYAPASVMATVEYTGLIWAFVLGFLIWGDIPVLAVWIGAALIASAGCVLVITERGKA